MNNRFITLCPVLGNTEVLGTIIWVKSYSVKTFAELYNVPKRFGILSIDAEGSGSKVTMTVSKF